MRKWGSCPAPVGQCDGVSRLGDIDAHDALASTPYATLIHPVGSNVVTGTTGRTSCGTRERLRPSFHPPRNATAYNTARSIFHDHCCGVIRVVMVYKVGTAWLPGRMWETPSRRTQQLRRCGVASSGQWRHATILLEDFERLFPCTCLQCTCRVRRASGELRFPRLFANTSTSLLRNKQIIHRPAASTQVRKSFGPRCLKPGLNRSLSHPVSWQTGCVSTRRHTNLEGAFLLCTSWYCRGFNVGPVPDDHYQVYRCAAVLESCLPL